MEVIRTCLNRKNRVCQIYGRRCEKDYDTNHHPNNYDCTGYLEANVVEFEVKETKKPENCFRKFFSEMSNPNSATGKLLKKFM